MTSLPTVIASMLIVATTLVAGPPVPDDDAPAAPTVAAPEPDVDEGKRLLGEGDKLADEGKPTDAVVKYKEAFERLLPGLRQVEFKRSVARDVTPRAELGDYLKREFDRQLTPEEFAASELGYKALGLIPADMDLKATMLELLTEEVAAFYDSRTETMHLIEEPPPGEGGKKPGLLEKLLGKKEGFDKDENKTVIAHELTHALADQNFDLDKLQDAVKGDDDQTTALAALIEGEATLAMMGASMEDWDGKQSAALPAAGLERSLGLMGPLMSTLGGPALRKAPPYLAESLTFPYLRGMVFCATLANKGGWKAINSAYENPPISTEQILHPEKYLDHPDLPMVIDLGELDGGEGWTEAGRNTAGEMSMAVMLKRHGGAKAAAGWDGDEFAVFRGPEGKLGLAWLTTWDDEAEAREFARGYGRFQATKLEAGAPEAPAEADALYRERDGRWYAVVRRGADVAVVEGFPAEATGRLVDGLLAAEKAEWKPAAKD